jgi:hypothetical protein
MQFAPEQLLCPECTSSSLLREVRRFTVARLIVQHNRDGVYCGEVAISYAPSLDPRGGGEEGDAYAFGDHQYLVPRFTWFLCAGDNEVGGGILL